MKKTQWVALFQDIKKTLVSFISIVVFVALGIAVFLGIKWNEPAIAKTVNEYLNNHAYHDYLLVFPYGFTNEDVDAVAAVDGIEAVEAAYSTYGTSWVGAERYTLAVQAITDNLDTATALEGVMPSSSDEVGVEQQFADATGLKVGDKISINTQGDGDSFLKNTEFTVTAIVEHPSYFARGTSFSRGLCGIGDGSVDFFVLMAKDAFNPEAYDNCFSQILIRGRGFSELNTFSKEYENSVGLLFEKIEECGISRAKLRCDEIIERANSEIANAEEKIADAEAELKDAKQEVVNGKQDIIDAEKEIARGERLLAENEQKLVSAQAEYNSGLAQYEDGARSLATAQTELQNALSAAGFSTSISTAEAEVRAKKAELQGLHTQAMGISSRLDDASELLVKYRTNPASVNVQEATDLIVDLVEQTGYSLTAAELDAIKSKAQETIALADSYGSLTGEDLAYVNTVLSFLGMSKDAAGAEQLSLYLQKYASNPQEAIEDDLRNALGLILTLEVQPDLSGAETLIAEKQLELQENIQQLNDGISRIDEALNGITAYRTGEKQLAEAKSQLDSAAAQIANGRQTLNQKKAELRNAKRQLEEAKLDIAEAEKKISDGEAELADKKREIEDAKLELSSFINYNGWTIQERAKNPSYDTIKYYAGSSRTLCFSMALLFVFVGLMVCYTSITRNVNEAQVTTGVQKALGFRRREIITHYMTYSILAVVLGALIGYLLGYFVIETIVNHAYMTQYLLGEISNVFTVTDALIITAIELVLISLVTWLPCRKLLKRQAVELLRGDNHGCGHTRFYEKTKLWERLSLYTQTTINNLANDSARVIATLVGVAGCTALIVMSLSLRVSIKDTPNKHFSDIWAYDVSLVSDNEVPGAQKALRDVLEQESVDYAPIRREAVFIEDENGKLSKADVIVPETTDGLSGFIKLNNWYGKGELSLEDNGVVISRTYEKHHNVKIGDTLRLMDMNGVYHECVVSGISEHYLPTIQLTMNQNYYKQVMSRTAVSNTLLINYGDADVEALQKKIRNTEGYFSLTDECEVLTKAIDRVSGTTMLIVYIGLCLSLTMALLVLLNLNIVCVNEKANELIIMRINGFSIGATKKYIYRDNIVLTALGILAGSFIGYGLGVWILNILQRDFDNFYTAPNPMPFAVAVGLTALFALITNLISLSRIDKLKVSDLKQQ